MAEEQQAHPVPHEQLKGDPARDARASQLCATLAAHAAVENHLGVLAPRLLPRSSSAHHPVLLFFTRSASYRATSAATVRGLRHPSASQGESFVLKSGPSMPSRVSKYVATQSDSQR